MADAEVLSTLVHSLIVASNPAPVAAETLRVLKKVVDNAKLDDDKFRRLPAGNRAVKEKIRDVEGGQEFLDALGFAPETGTGDWVMKRRDLDALDAASAVLSAALADLPAPAPAPTPVSVPAPAPTQAQAQTQTKTAGEDPEYAERVRAAAARQEEIRRKAEAERAQREAIKRAMRVEQADVRTRPVVASHRVDAPRRDGGAGSGGALGSLGGPGGSIPYVASDAELDAVVAGPTPVLVNFTASWCGPCQAMAPAVEGMRSRFPNVRFVKVDIDANQDSPGRYQVSAVPTFILFKQGSMAGRVSGANPSGVEGLLRQV